MPTEANIAVGDYVEAGRVKVFCVGSNTTAVSTPLASPLGSALTSLLTKLAPRSTWKVGERNCDRFRRAPLRAAIAHASTVEVAAGHQMMAEQPEAVLAALLALFDPA